MTITRWMAGFYKLSHPIYHIFLYINLTSKLFEDKIDDVDEKIGKRLRWRTYVNLNNILGDGVYKYWPYALWYYTKFQLNKLRFNKYAKTCLFSICLMNIGHKHVFAKTFSPLLYTLSMLFASIDDLRPENQNRALNKGS